MAVARAGRSARRRARRRAVPPHPTRLRRRRRRQPDECVRSVDFGGALALMAAASVRLEHRAAVVGADRRAQRRVPLAHRARSRSARLRRCVIAFLFWWRAARRFGRQRPRCSSPRSRRSSSPSSSTMRISSTPIERSWRGSAAKQPRPRLMPAGAASCDRLASVPRYLQLYFGVPALALAAWGAALLWRRARAIAPA